MNFTALTDILSTLPAKGVAGYDCLVLRGGKTALRTQYGYANREAGVPIDEGTIYRMYSMTKPITCAAALTLYERGRFLLDDPLGEYLPEFREMQVREADGKGGFALRPAARPITVRNLFTMTAGFTYELDSPSLLALGEETNWQYTTRQFAAALAREPLSYDPGDHWAYSLAHDVLAALVEELAGMEFEEYLRRVFFEPLGMEDAHFVVPEEKLSRCALRYCHTPEGEITLDTPDPRANVYRRSPAHKSGGAGLSCTVNDYARFADAMCNLGASRATGARILGEGTVQLMRANQIAAPHLARDFNWDQMRGYGYGLGVRTMTDRALSGSPGGLGEFGWGGAAGTFVIIDPEWDTVMVFGQQSSPPEEDWIQTRIRNILYPCLNRE